MKKLDELIEKIEFISKTTGLHTELYRDTAEALRLCRDVVEATENLVNKARAYLAVSMSADEACLCMVACNAPEMSRKGGVGESLHTRCDQIRTCANELDAALSIHAALAAYPPKPASGTELGQKGGE